MNNRRNAQVAASKRRRRIRSGKREEQMQREQVASLRRGMFIQHHAQFGLKSWQGNPIYFPRHKKLKGWQRDHRGKKVA